MSGKIQYGIRVWRDAARFAHDISVCFYRETVGHGFAVARLGEYEDVPPNHLMPMDAIHSIGPEMAQELMNGLWECGIRPAQGQGSAGQLEATRAHLEDMRALVFKDKP